MQELGRQSPSSSPARLALAWAFVGVPLVWGVVMTLRGALALFA